MYRHGGRSQVTMMRSGCVQASSKSEIAEHGRWRTQNRDMRPCQNTRVRALWRTASTSHFFVCKVWIFRSFNGIICFCFSMPLFFEEFMELKGGGVLLFQREGLKNNFAMKGGGVFYQNPPYLLYPPPPASRKNSIL
jgi:hypothetical protein